MSVLTDKYGPVMWAIDQCPEAKTQKPKQAVLEQVDLRKAG